MKEGLGIVLLATCVCVLAQQDVLKSRLSGVDIDGILENNRVLQSYINCFLDKGPCTPEGREGKKLFPQIYKTNCAECSDENKLLLKKTVRAFVAKRKEDYVKIVNKYDPTHEKEKDFMEWINSDD